MSKKMSKKSAEIALCGLCSLLVLVAGCTTFVRHVGSIIAERGEPQEAQCFLFYGEPEPETVIITLNESGIQITTTDSQVEAE
jgi:hypothetical protein